MYAGSAQHQTTRYKMFTLKFHESRDDYWEVYPTNYYQVRTELDRRHVTFSVDGNSIDQEVSNDNGDWSVCYVVNEKGETVDRIYPPQEKS